MHFLWPQASLCCVQGAGVIIRECHKWLVDRWTDVWGLSALRWRNIFWLPVVVFPIVATVVHVVVVIKFDSVKPTDDLHCDSSDPLW